MPSQKVLQQKQQMVVDLAEKLGKAVAVVVVDYKGINVENDTQLRKEMRESNVDYLVVKNSIIRFAINGTELEGLSNVLEGTTALAISYDDPICPAKIVTNYVDKIQKGFEIKAGFVDGEVIDAAKVTELGKLPSKDQLVAQLLSVLTGNIRGLAVALNAIAEKESA